MARWMGTTGAVERRRYERLATAAEPVLRRLVRLRPPIFVVGCPRSGTTVFTGVFGGHPQLVNLSEAAWIWDRNYKDPEGDHLRTERDVTEPERRRITGIVRLFMLTRPGRVFLNKHPRNSLRIRFLDALFPGCRFIHVLRDGHAVVGSLLNAREARESRQRHPYGNFCKPLYWRRHLELPAVEQAAHQWLDIVQYTRRALRELGPHRSIDIRYEEFCASPATILADCDRFCRLDDAPRDLSAVKSQNHKWSAQFSPEELAAINAICGPLLSELGYVQDASSAPGAPQAVSPA